MTTAVSTRQIKSKPAFRTPFKVALLDLYDGEINLGIPSIHGLVSKFNRSASAEVLEIEDFTTRKSCIVPGLDHDLYISSGGPGSPFDGVGSKWEATYFNLIDEIWAHNESVDVKQGYKSPKHVLFICHSFQMMCRHFELGEVVARKSQSFGVFKTFQTPAGLSDPLLNGLKKPFYVADFRDWQVVQPNIKNIDAFGATIIVNEKKRPHIPLERAMMGIRVSREMVGVQFHPEANPEGMLLHFQEENHQHGIIEKHGELKFKQIIERLKDPSFLLHTYQTIIPNFFRDAITSRRTSRRPA